MGPQEHGAQPREHRQGASRGCSHRNVMRGGDPWKGCRYRPEGGRHVLGRSLWALHRRQWTLSSQRLLLCCLPQPCITSRFFTWALLGVLWGQGWGEGSLEPGNCSHPDPCAPR